MTKTSHLKKSIKSVLIREKNINKQLDKIDVIFNDRISGKRKSTTADQLVFNNNSFMAYIKNIDYYLPFNRIEEIKSEGSLLWSRKAFEKENKANIITQIINKVKEGKMYIALFDFFRGKDRFLGLITIGSSEGEFWVTVEECDENSYNDDNLFTRDERHVFETAEKAINYSLCQYSDISPFDFIEGTNTFIFDISKSFKCRIKMNTIQLAIVMEKILADEELKEFPGVLSIVKERRNLIKEAEESLANAMCDAFEELSMDIDLGTTEFVEKNFLKMIKEDKDSYLSDFLELQAFSNKRIYISPEVVRKVRDYILSKGELRKDSERWFREQLDKNAKLNEAEELLKKGDYSVAYWRFKWAGELNKKNLGRVLEGLKEINYVRVCLRERFGDGKEKLERLAEEFVKKSMLEWALTAYYLTKNKIKIDEMMGMIQKELSKTAGLK
jgi:hypothetical protein